MIIQCRQCRTRFRFDDSLMEPDGMWMRCSRCRHVFFQENPLKFSKAVVPHRPVEEQAPGHLSFETAPDRPVASRPDEDMKNFLQGVLGREDESFTVRDAAPPWEPQSKVEVDEEPDPPLAPEGRRASKTDYESEPEIPWEPQPPQEPEWEFEPHGGDLPPRRLIPETESGPVFESGPAEEPVFEPDPEYQPMARDDKISDDAELYQEPEPDEDHDDIGEYALHEEEISSPAARPVKKRRFWVAALWAVLVIIVVPAVLYTFVIPEQGRRLAGMFVEQGRRLKMAFSDKPRHADGESVISQINIRNVQQRVVSNYLLGSIRVVEGFVVNQADFPVTRLRVKAELLDAYSVVLESRTSYAGNVLTDEELMNLTDEEMQTRLSYPEGRENSNERVIPNGQIPFMIVFITVPQNAIKTTVAVSGAERLL